MVQIMENADVRNDIQQPSEHHLLQKWLRGEVGIEALREWLIHVHTSEVQTPEREPVHISVIANERLERYGWPR